MGILSRISGLEVFKTLPFLLISLTKYSGNPSAATVLTGLMVKP